MSWIKIANCSEVSQGEMKQMIVDNENLVLFHLADGFHVTSNLCTHRKQYLTDGALDGNIVECPRHGGKFEVKTGTPVAGPCVVPIQTYPVDIRNDEVWIDF